jgi:hypothetical protein
MYYKTRWGSDHPPFICKFSGALHFPEVEVWVEAPAECEEIKYKDIDKLMYESRSSESTFERLAEGIAERLARSIQLKGKQARAKVTVRVRDAKDPDFWVEATEDKET